MLERVSDFVDGRELLHFVALFHHLSERDLLLHIAENQHHIMADLTRLQSAVQANTTATQQAVNALQAPSDQAAIDAAASQIEGNTSALNAATVPPAAPATPA